MSFMLSLLLITSPPSSTNELKHHLTSLPSPLGATVRRQVYAPEEQSVYSKAIDSFYWLQRSHLSALSLIFGDLRNEHFIFDTSSR